VTARDVVRTAGSVLLAAWGALLLTRPEEVATALTAGSPPPDAVVRALGARRVVQHLAVALVPSHRLALTAAGVDALHAVSMLAAASVVPRYRRAALTSAVGAAGAAVFTAASAPPPSSRP
jgi:hypothetical protein